MIKDITVGQYIPGESVLHRADPRTKILLSLVFMVVTLIVNTYIGLVILSFFTLLVIIISGTPLGFVLRGIKPIIFVLIFAMLINLFTIQGETALDLGFVNITYEAINVSVKLFLRLMCLFIGLSLLTITSTPIALADGIEKLMSPFKKIGLPVHEIAMMMTIALRFIPTLIDETDKIMKAQASRGADFDTGNIIQKAKSFIPVLIPLFVSAFRRADELAVAMEARCYRGSIGRTRMKQLHFKKVDLFISLFMVVFSTGLLYLEYM